MIPLQSGGKMEFDYETNHDRQGYRHKEVPRLNSIRNEERGNRAGILNGLDE
jgi:hypothetical protein